MKKNIISLLKISAMTAITVASLNCICYSANLTSASQILHAMKKNHLVQYEYQKMQLNTYRKNKQTSNRSIKIFTHVPKTDTLHQTIITASPNSLRGTIFILQLQDNKLINNFLYMPSNKRWLSIKNSSNQSKNILNTDFSQSDFISSNYNKKNYYRLKDATIHGKPCFVLRSRSNQLKNKNYSYKKLYISKKYLIPIYVNFMDSNDKLVKSVWVSTARLIDSPVHSTFCQPTVIRAKSFKYKTESLASISKIKISNTPIIQNTNNRRMMVQQTNDILRTNFGSNVSKYKKCI